MVFSKETVMMSGTMVEELHQKSSSSGELSRSSSTVIICWKVLRINSVRIQCFGKRETSHTSLTSFYLREFTQLPNELRTSTMPT
jgi:hypothetical protein